MRLDKYLKVSRLIKRRTVANEACDGERVSVNGVRMVAGTDYTLRAAEGVLDFLPRRRISSSDRIEVEWQAAVLDYQRGLQAGTASSANTASSLSSNPTTESWAGTDKPCAFA